MTWEEIIAYLDDVMVLGKDFLTHLKVLRRVFERFRRYNLKLKPKKCHLFQKKVPFLGRIVSKDGVQVDPEKIKAVAKYPQPKNTKEVEKFLGFANYHREFIERFAERSSLLYQLTGKAEFIWTDEHTAQFEDIRRALVSTPVLAYPQADAPFILDTDASNTAVAGVLSQVQDGMEKVISYGSAVLTAPQRNYCTTRKELLAIIRFTRQYRHYLLGRTVRVRTDNSSLLWLTRFREPCGQIARWLEELSQYDLQIEHRKGRLHVNADTLSRIPDDLEYCPNYTGKVLTELPCGGCKYCARAHQEWARFDEDVDDVIPLAVKSVRSMRLADSSNWFDGITEKEWIEEQEKDEDLSMLRDFLVSGMEPTEPEHYLQNRTVKTDWSRRELFKLERSILYYKWEDAKEVRWLHVVPTGLKHRICQLAHDNPTVGHMGQEKSYLQLQGRVYWVGMRQDITTHVKTCGRCSVSKKTHRKPKYNLQSFHAGIPMERVHLDILGPFQTSRAGNKYLLVMVDQFTKWIEIEPLPEQSSERIAKASVDRFFSHFGYPNTIHTDQGRNFDGELFRSLCQLLHVTKTRTTPYRPSSNGQVERYNRTILQTIRAFLQMELNQWDEQIQLVAAAIRATVNRSTGFTPNMLMLGKEVRLPLDLMLGSDSTTPSPPPGYLQHLQRAMKEAHEVARKSLKSYQKRQKDEYDTKVVVTRFEVGDVVYLLDSSTKVKQSTKLRPIYTGPYIVIKVLSPLLFKIKNRKREVVMHHDRIKPCLDRNLPLWLRRMRHEILETDLMEEEDDLLDDDCLNRLFNGSDDSLSPPGIVRQRPGSPQSMKPRSKPSPNKDATDENQTDELPRELPASRSGRQRRLPDHLKDYTH